jgi:hypothetical protein
MPKPSAERVSANILSISTRSDGEVVVRGVCGKSYAMPLDEAIKFFDRLEDAIKEGRRKRAEGRESISLADGRGIYNL